MDNFTTSKKIESHMYLSVCCKLLWVINTTKHGSQASKLILKYVVKSLRGGVQSTQTQCRGWSMCFEHLLRTLKLFSLGLRLMMMLNVSYGSSVPLWMLLVMSCWYWFGSSHTRNVLASPLSLGFGSGPRPQGVGKNTCDSNRCIVQWWPLEINRNHSGSVIWYIRK